MDHSFDQIRQLQIRGIKSIAECDIELKALNVLVGANGAGKSNLIFAFKLLRKTLEAIEGVGDKALETFVSYEAGADSILHYGRKHTKSARIAFILQQHDGQSDYIKHEAILIANAQNKFDPPSHIVYNTPTEDWFRPRDYFQAFIRGISIHHINDTTPESNLMKNPHIEDTFKVYESFVNLPAFLNMLQNNFPDYFNDIVKMIRRIAPFFEGFVLEFEPGGKSIRLRWKHYNSDDPFDVSALSDGTLRFIALATLLLQPQETLPSLIIIDEPELGLHPQAIQYLAAMLRSCSARTQIIVATQSVTLLDQFTWKDLIITDFLNGASRFRRLSEEESKTWVEDYSLGELWTGNWLGGVPGWRDD